MKPVLPLLPPAMGLSLRQMVIEYICGYDCPSVVFVFVYEVLLLMVMTTYMIVLSALGIDAPLLRFRSFFCRR